jgi:hypothetical protein
MPEYPVRVKGKCTGRNKIGFLFGLPQNNSKEIQKDFAVHFPFKSRYPVDPKFSWLNPAKPHEFRIIGRDVDI